MYQICIFFFQLLVSAYDTGAPSAVVSETVIITVNRNLNTPIFDQQEYVTTIYDYEPVGSSVVDVNAVDADITSPENLIMYNIVDSAFNINAEDTFTIHPITGLITTNRVLTSDAASVYRVRICYAYFSFTKSDLIIIDFMSVFSYNWFSMYTFLSW